MFSKSLTLIKRGYIYVCFSYFCFDNVQWKQYERAVRSAEQKKRISLVTKFVNVKV
jgi:hypothetical protein